MALAENATVAQRVVSNQFQCICASSLSAAFNQDAVYSILYTFYKS